jgi:cellulose synthase/poly-beta-1,6-N-acetylglucosamine synthase-like glycosyltransferase
MLSIVITAFREPHTVGRAIEAFEAQALPESHELLVICPDQETSAVVEQYAKRNPRVRHVRDEGRGKPAAVNLAFIEASGDIVILSDGDVHVGSQAVQALSTALEDPQVGAVSGRPVSLNPRNTMLGYWSHVLLDAGAHRQRLLRDRRGEFLECSGYLYAVRRALVRPVPEDALAEDGLVSQMVWQQGFRTAYAPEAEVFVKFPSSIQDWIRQKTRTSGGYAQTYAKGAPGIKSFRAEAAHGTLSALRYAGNLRELWWTLLLFVARIYVWLRVWVDVRLRNRPFEEVWQRVESTK